MGSDDGYAKTALLLTYTHEHINTHYTVIRTMGDRASGFFFFPFTSNTQIVFIFNLFSA